MTTTGIGSRFRTTLVTRSSLTPAPSSTSAPWVAFFFGSTGLDGPANMHAAGLAEVGNGWAGVVEVSTSSGVASLAPSSRTSAAEVMTALVRLAERRLGGTWGWYPQCDGRIVIVSTLAFDLVATGSTRGWLGFTGAYAGASAYVAHEPHVAGVYPSGGLLLEGADGVPRSSQLGATGGRVSGSRRLDQPGRLVLYGSFTELADTMGLWATDSTWDVVLGGTWATRVRLEWASRERFGVLPSHVRVALRTREVSL